MRRLSFKVNLSMNLYAIWTACEANLRRSHLTLGGGCKVQMFRPNCLAGLKYEWKCIFRLTGRGLEQIERRMLSNCLEAPPSDLRPIISWETADGSR